jgi:hypothetical protein
MTMSYNDWAQWVFYTTASTANSTAIEAWPEWAFQATTTATDTTFTITNVWPAWAAQQWIVPLQRWVNQQPIEEYEAELEEHRRAAAAVAAERKAEREAAVARAEELLKENLDAQQREDYETLQAFLVKAESGSTYRIHKGLAGNIDLLSEDGEVLGRYCIHIGSEYPVPDNLLAQKLWLEHDEQEFQRIGNYTPAGARY